MENELKNMIRRARIAAEICTDNRKSKFGKHWVEANSILYDVKDQIVEQLRKYKIDEMPYDILFDIADILIEYHNILFLLKRHQPDSQIEKYKIFLEKLKIKIACNTQIFEKIILPILNNKKPRLR